jgi:mRNA-degrading endonuclease YafQ of YafQ-DinJ toxin-antitoxin module
MRTIEQTGQFRRDYKREAKGPHRETLVGDFTAIVRPWQMTKRLPRDTVTMR